MTEYFHLKDIPKSFRNACIEAAMLAGFAKGKLFAEGGYFRVAANNSVTFSTWGSISKEERSLAKKQDSTRILLLPHKNSSLQNNTCWQSAEVTIEEAETRSGRPRKYRGKHRSHTKGQSLRNFLNQIPEKR